MLDVLTVLSITIQHTFDSETWNMAGCCILWWIILDQEFVLPIIQSFLPAMHEACMISKFTTGIYNKFIGRFHTYQSDIIEFFYFIC